MRRKEGDRGVAPVVDQATRAVLGIELKHRQQLDGGDAQSLEVRDLLDHAGISAAALLGDAGALVAREPSHVHLVHDGPSGRSPEWRVTFPVIHRWVRHHALHRGRGSVAFLARRLATVASRHHHASGIRVEQDLGGIESHAVRRILRSRHPIAIYLSRLNAGYEDVPVVVRAVDRGIQANRASWASLINTIEEEELDPGSVLGVDTEVDALRRRYRAQGRTVSGAVAGGALRGAASSCAALRSLVHVVPQGRAGPKCRRLSDAWSS